MRDVSYHVMSSISDEVLREAGGDERLLEFYLAEYNAVARSFSGGDTTSPFDLDQLWYHYRLHGCWVLAAWIISAGAGENFFDEKMAAFTVGRIGRACERIGVREVPEKVVSNADVAVRPDKGSRREKTE